MNQKEFFNIQAGKWDETQAGYRPHPANLLDRLAIRRGEDVLEIGCGSGWLLEPLARKIAPGRLYALDFSGEMLRKAVVRQFNSPVVIMYAGAEDIPLPDQAVDRVLMINTFSQFPDPKRVISEVSRILRKGGRLDVKYFFSREEVNSHHESKPELKGCNITDNHILHGMLGSVGFMSSVTDGDGGFYVTCRLTR
ncbi:MAG TPA: class I SAM-dependent methyltransferase [Geobacteraceae bacterium]|nr:class I SAM-dependent methyltransferase [Geobacteraceae bacterium]